MGHSAARKMTRKKGIHYSTVQNEKKRGYASEKLNNVERLEILRQHTVQI